MNKILISTGGSGGHVIPALNLFYHLQKDFDVYLYTDKRGAKYFPKEVKKTVFDVKQIPEKKYLLPLKIIFLFSSFIKSLIYLREKKFDIVVSTGGYMSLPIVLAAKLYKKKIFLFEPNSIIGKSNKFLLRFSNKIFCYDKNLKGLNKKYLKKIVEIPPILNKCFYIKNINKIKHDTINILIIGGSQSSLFFTKHLKSEIINISKRYKTNLSQQLSPGFDVNSYKKDYDKHNIESHLFFFNENYLCNQNNFDIAISRSGASSLAELAHLNIPFIAIPFPHAIDNHQYLNAKKYYDLNCCWIIEEKNFKSGDIFEIINQIMVNKNEYINVKNNLKKFNANITWEGINKRLTKHFL